MRTLLLALLLLFVPVAAQVVPGTTTELLDADGCTLPCTVGSVTVPATGNDNMAIVSVRVSNSLATWTSRGATLGGEALVEIQKSPAGTSVNELVNFCLPEADFPAAGAQNLILTGAWNGNSAVSAYVMFLTQADQACPITNHTVSDAGGGATSAANTLTPISAGAMLFHSVIGGSGMTSLAATSPQVLIDSQIVNSGTHGISSEILTDPSSQQAAFTWASATFYRSGAFVVEWVGGDEPPEPEVLITDVPVVECFCGGLFHVPAQPLPEAQEEEVYAGHSITIFGGAAPRTCAIASGALPSGVSLSPACEITGTPDAATAGAYAFKVLVTDADGGLADGDLALVVNVASGGGETLTFYENGEDGNLTADPTWAAAGGCAVTSTATLEGAKEVTKSTATECVLFTGENQPQAYCGFDVLSFAPATNRDQTFVLLDSLDEVLVSCRFETDTDIFCKTPGMTLNAGRGFQLANLSASGLTRGYVELHYVAGTTGSNALFRVRFNGGVIQEFSAGTATGNVQRAVFRDDNDGAGDFVYDRIECKDNDWPGRGPLPPDPGDTTPPTVLSTVPTTGATGVGLSSNIQVNFSEPMDPATITSVTFTLANGGAVAGVVTYTGTTATFNPDASLSATTLYTAIITAGAEDVAGNAIAAQYQWTFTTGSAADTTPPTVSSAVPVDDAAGVPINQVLTANFSEAMDPASITTASFTLARGATPISGTVSVSGSSASFTPTASLATNSLHTATITTTAQDLAGNNLASNFTWDFTTGGSPVTPPWITNFAPQRTHYVTPSGSGSANGTIGNPESLVTARDHYIPGDLHILRGGTYNHTLGLDNAFNTNCTQSNPCVFKSFVDSLGQEENVIFPFGVELPGEWNWFVGIHSDLTTNTNTYASGFSFRQAGDRVINSVVEHTKENGVSWYRSAGSIEPGQVVYGNVIWNIANNITNAGHNVYMHNDWTAQGYKYAVQNLLLAPQPGRRLFQANDTHGDRGISGLWMEKNFIGDANPNSNTTPRSGQTVVFDGAGAPSWYVAHHTVLKENFFVDHFHNTSLLQSVRTNAGAIQLTATNNYFARANLGLDGYLGNSGTHDPSVFTGNEIYDPPGGKHLPTFVTKGESGVPGDGLEGTFKIRDTDVWDNNTYGGTFSAELFCNNTNFGNRTLAQWRSDTDGCRETPASAVGFDINSTNPANPTTNKITVVKNEWQCPVGCPFTDQARGNIYVVNWQGSSTVTVDISSVVRPNKTYRVHYARDYHGTKAATGVCPSAGACNVSLPTKRTNSDTAGRFGVAYVITAQP